MKYKRANDVLPQHLLESLQQYAEGCYIYIPKTTNRTRWGHNTGARQMLTERNTRIRADFQQGATIEMLAGRYYLSAESIKRIVYTKKR